MFFKLNLGIIFPLPPMGVDGHQKLARGKVGSREPGTAAPSDCLLTVGLQSPAPVFLHEWTVDSLQSSSVYCPPCPPQGPGHATYPINKCLLKAQVNERKGGWN